VRGLLGAPGVAGRDCHAPTAAAHRDGAVGGGDREEISQTLDGHPAALRGDRGLPGGDLQRAVCAGQRLGPQVPRRQVDRGAARGLSHRHLRVTLHGKALAEGEQVPGLHALRAIGEQLGGGVEQAHQPGDGSHSEGGGPDDLARVLRGVETEVQPRARRNRPRRGDLFGGCRGDRRVGHRVRLCVGLGPLRIATQRARGGDAVERDDDRAHLAAAGAGGLAERGDVLEIERARDPPSLAGGGGGGLDHP